MGLFEPVMCPMRRSVSLSTLSLSLASISSYALAEVPRIPSKTMSNPPTIDGTINPSEWTDAATFEGLMEERNRAPAPEAGKFWVASDDQYVYFAARLADSEPGKIQATEYRSNVSVRGDDHVALFLDLSGSLSDFNEFRFNPGGATSINLAGGRAVKAEWTGEIVSKGRITAEGWEVEARIPWKILNLPGQGKRDLRLNVLRHIPRSNLTYLWVSPNGGHESETPFWEGVPLPKQPTDRSIRFLPYTYLGYDPDTKRIVNAGFDVKTKLNEQNTLVASVSPDFRNIENQILSLDFSRFERLSSESRPFFQEGSNYLDSALFASQRIQRFDVGVNAYGKISDTVQYGVLNTNDFGDQNAFVTNFSYTPSAKEGWRGTFTSLNERGLSNSAYLLRYARQVGPVSLRARQVASQDTELGNGRDTSLAAEYSANGTWAMADYQDTTEGFRPRLGFFPESNFKGPHLGTSKVFQWKTGPVNMVGSKLEFADYRRQNGDQYRRMFNWDAFTILRSGALVQFNTDWTRFEGSDDRLTYVTAGFPFNDPYRSVFVNYSWGEFGGDKYDSVRLDVNQRPTSQLQLTGSLQAVRYNGYEQQAILGFNYDLRQDRSITGRMVRQGNDTNAYFAFRRSGNKGMEYYLIVGDPNARTFRSSVILKLVTPFSIG